MDDDLDIAEEFDAAESTHVQPIAHSGTTCLIINKSTPLSVPQSSCKQHKKHENSSRCKVEPTEEDRECTFAPKINGYRSRNLGEFLEFQKGFVERKQMKLAKIKEELNHKESVEFTGKPTIDSRSKRMAQRALGEPVFARLSRDRERSESAEREQSFQPRILGKSKSLSRNDPVGELLYSDAQRRIEKEKITARQSLKKPYMAPRINNNTDKLVIRAIRQEFDSFVSSQLQVTPIVALTILSQLFNVDLNPKKDQQTESVCEKVLSHVDVKQKVPCQRLWEFIEAALGRHQQNSNEFNQSQQTEIHKQFGYFYRQRLTKVPKQVEEQQLSFQPEILKNSERLAAKKRQKMLTEANNMLSQHPVGLSVDDTKDLPLADLYILERMHKQQKNAQEKLFNEEKQLKECTFKPSINTNKTPKSSSKKALAISSKRSSKQFKLKSNSNNNNQNTFGTLNTQYSIDKEHRNSVGRHSLSKQSKIHEIKDIEKTVLRLSAARKSRQYNNLLKQRGYPKDVDNWESYRQSEKRAVDHANKELKGYCGERKKGFVFDVHVGGGVIETIEVAPGQSLQQLVDQVASKHDFDSSKRGKLLEMMKYHLRLHSRGDKQNNNRPANKL